jgi:hypothetical protein
MSSENTCGSSPESHSCRNHTGAHAERLGSISGCAEGPIDRTLKLRANSKRAGRVSPHHGARTSSIPTETAGEPRSWLPAPRGGRGGARSAHPGTGSHPFRRDPPLEPHDLLEPQGMAPRHLPPCEQEAHASLPGRVRLPLQSPLEGERALRLRPQPRRARGGLPLLPSHG